MDSGGFHENLMTDILEMFLSVIYELRPPSFRVTVFKSFFSTVQYLLRSCMKNNTLF